MDTCVTSLGSLQAQHVDALHGAVQALLAEFGLETLVVHSGRAKKRTSFDDQYFPLRLVPHFAHWVHLVQADCLVVVRHGAAKPELVWPSEVDFWEQPVAPERRDFESLFDINRPQKLTDYKISSGKIAVVTDAPELMGELGIESRLTPALLASLDALRVRKSPYEVLCLREANRVACLGHRAVREAFFSGDPSELELHLEFLRATGQDDCEAPYKNIVAKGKNAAIFHHIAYAKKGHNESSLLLDAGAVFEGYCSDISRTWVKDSTSAESGIFAQMVRLLDNAQQSLCADVRVGMRYESLHDTSHVRVAEILAEIGLVRLSAQEICDRGISRRFYPHGLGHSLGLQCHDVGCATIAPRVDNPFLRNTSGVAVGQTFTIEPGIYFIDSLMQQLSAACPELDTRLVGQLAQFGGIRIEDDLHVVAGGATENLTRTYLEQLGDPR